MTPLFSILKSTRREINHLRLNNLVHIPLHESSMSRVLLNIVIAILGRFKLDDECVRDAVLDE